MNWSKAKTILIFALVITNVFLLVNYMSTEKKALKEIDLSTEATIEYLNGKGISLACDIPREARSLSVYSLEFAAGDKGGAVYTTDIDGIRLEVIGLSEGKYIRSITETEKQINTLPAYTALLKCIGSVSDKITEIELVYLVDRAAFVGQEGEDTALPYWKISSGSNSYYYSAFAE